MTFGTYRYDTEHRLLFRGGEEIPVPPRVTAVLECLLRGAGKILSKDELLDMAWEGTYVGEEALYQAISLLRAALRDDARNPTYIQTVPRRGYRFIGRLEAFDDPPVSAAPTTAPTDPPVAAAPTSAPADPPVATTPPSPPAQMQVSHDTDFVSVWVKAEALQVVVQVDREGVYVATSRTSGA